MGGFFMHLLLAASMDATADIIVEGLGDKVIRLNNDRRSVEMVADENFILIVR
jgi:hypothetical protein